MVSRESSYQADLIKRLERDLPGCVVLKNDTSYLQGVPDLLILFQENWAMLEVKRSADAPVQPNQDYYVSLFAQMSYSAFIYPENEEDIINGLQQAFGLRRKSRISQR